MSLEDTSYSPELRQQAHKLFHGDCTFVQGVASSNQLPATTLTEVAFAGRSNVGKSSLLNVLTSRQQLARTSNTPGRTQQLNFFNLRDQLMLVDLPGYGYARRSKTEVKKWHNTVEAYLSGRQQLRRVLLLLDARMGQVKPHDITTMELLDEAAVVYQIVLTKADKVSATDIQKFCDNITALQEQHAAMHPDIIITSSRKREGIEGLRCSLAELVL